MRIIIYALAFYAVTTITVAQQNRIEITNPSTPVEDSKPNSETVPDAHVISSRFDSVLVVRFKYQTDLLAGIDSIVKHYKINNAVILSGIGSVRNYHIHTVSNRTFPSKNMYVKDLSAPADILSMNGYIIDGRVHAHITLANADKAFGGHLEFGTNVFTFAVITIGVFRDGIDLSRVDDKTYR
jgi:Predicted DNA-binding protein with PD1-like DNA-binding motif